MIREKRLFNQDWSFHLGEIGQPKKTVTKAGCIGGLTSTLNHDHMVEIGPGGKHFLKLIAQGNHQKGLMMLAGTDFSSQIDSDWQTVTLPHDWKQNLPYSNRSELLMSGSKEEGVGYYRKSFYLEETYSSQQRIIIRFEGLMRMADIWLNGCYLGQHISGYSAFELDITDFLKYQNEGENVLLVRLDTTTGSEGWWYEGAGIYRDVWLIYQPKLQIKESETYLTTEFLDDQQAKIAYQLSIENQEMQEKKVTLSLSIDKKVFLRQNIKLAGLEKFQLSGDFIMNNPKLWSIDTPYLYHIKITICSEGNLIDCIEFCHGIRVVEYLSDGFYLNHKRLELRGICEHQDFGGIGVALSKDILRYKLERMKAMGVNAYRSAHHFASHDLLDLCDEIGIIVMNENRILETSEWRVQDFKQEIRETRHHPCLCFWSICNEEVIGSTSLSRRMIQHLLPQLKVLSKNVLYVSAELLNPEGLLDEEYVSCFDVIGINYPESAVMGDSLKNMQQRYPNLKFMSTESASYFSTRGIYKDDAAKGQCSNLGSAYSMIFPGERPKGEPGRGGTSTPENTLAFLKKHPELGGVFLWTAFDYCGEPSPFVYPAVSSQFGICDLAGIPKDYYYFYQANWTDKPVLHIATHWNKEGLTINDKNEVEIRVFTNCESACLYLNDHVYEEKAVVDGKVSWLVTFEPGEIRVVGQTKEKQLIEVSRFTHDEKIATVTKKMIYESECVCLAQLIAKDKNNNEMYNCYDEIPQNILDKTMGIFINGNPYFEQELQGNGPKFFAGSCVVLQKNNVDC